MRIKNENPITTNPLPTSKIETSSSTVDFTALGQGDQTVRQPLDINSDPMAARFNIGNYVIHRRMGLVGIVVDADPTFNHDQTLLDQIDPAQRPDPNQPFYHVLINTDHETLYMSYISEQSLTRADSCDHFDHPLISAMFRRTSQGQLVPIRIPH